LCRSASLRFPAKESGFALIEVLVALAVVAVSLAAIGSLVAANIRATRDLNQRLELVETTSAIVASMPDRGQLAPGNLSGEVADLRWRLDVLGFVANFIDPGQPTPWIPQTVVLRVQSPGGQMLRLDTVRLRHRPGYTKPGSAK
jgi:general secretion pathway protein I